MYVTQELMLGGGGGAGVYSSGRLRLGPTMNVCVIIPMNACS